MAVAVLPNVRTGANWGPIAAITHLDLQLHIPPQCHRSPTRRSLRHGRRFAECLDGGLGMVDYR